MEMESGRQGRAPSVFMIVYLHERLLLTDEVLSSDWDLGWKTGVGYSS